MIMKAQQDDDDDERSAEQARLHAQRRVKCARPRRSRAAAAADLAACTESCRATRHDLFAVQQLLWLERLQCHASEQIECARRASAYLISRKALSDTGGVGSTSGVKRGGDHRRPEDDVPLGVRKVGYEK